MATCIFIFRLKINRQKVCVVSSLLDAWVHLRNRQQSMLTEAIEQLSINTDLGVSILKVLHDACDKLKAQSEFSNVHILILVEEKFLSLYSSKNAHDLYASDILLTMLMCWVVNQKRKGETSESSDDRTNILLPESSCSKEEQITFGTKLANPTSEDITNLFSMAFTIVQYLLISFLLHTDSLLHCRRIERFFY